MKHIRIDISLFNHYWGEKGRGRCPFAEPITVNNNGEVSTRLLSDDDWWLVVCEYSPKIDSIYFVIDTIAWGHMVVPYWIVLDQKEE